MARYIFHYEDGTEVIAPMLMGEDIVDCFAPSSTHSTDVLLRTGIPNVIVRLLRKAWQNPHPDKVISHIDFISAKAKAAPFVVAITLE